MRGWGKARGEETIYILKTVYFLLFIDFLLFTLNLIPCVFVICVSFLPTCGHSWSIHMRVKHRFIDLWQKEQQQQHLDPDVRFIYKRFFLAKLEEQNVQKRRSCERTKKC